jgi:hypothetical protein
MRDLSYRFALAALLVSGVLTVAIPPLPAVAGDSLANSLLAHRHYMQVLLGAALALSVFFASWRLPAAILGTMSKAGLLVLSVTAGNPATSFVDCGILVALAMAAAILARDQWQEARWQGTWPSRGGAWN